MAGRRKTRTKAAHQVFIVKNMMGIEQPRQIPPAEQSSIRHQAQQFSTGDVHQVVARPVFDRGPARSYLRQSVEA